MIYHEADGAWLLKLPVTAEQIGWLAEYATTAYFADRTGSSMRLSSDMDVGALQPYFQLALQNSTCPMLPIGVQACNTSTGQLYTWNLNCSADQPDRARAEVFARLQYVLDAHVDIGIAVPQPADGFASAVLPWRVDDQTVFGADEALRATLREVSGSPVVATASLPYVNVLGAGIAAIVGVLVYLMAQIQAPEAATTLAMKYLQER